MTMSTRRPSSALSMAPKTMASERMLSRPTVSGSRPDRTAKTKSERTPRMAVDPVLGRERRRLDRTEWIEQTVARARPHNFNPDLVGPVPGQRSLGPDEAPRAFPRRRRALRAPGPPIDKDSAGLELEDRRCGRTLPIPGMRRIPLPTINVGGRQSGHAARGVEPMDRHIEQQHVIHLLAETAEMRREEKVCVNAGERPDYAGPQRTSDAAHTSDVPPVLDHCMDRVPPLSPAGSDRARRPAFPPSASR